MDKQYVAIEGSYRFFEIALFKKKELIDSVHPDVSRNAHASSILLPELQKLLTKNSTKLSDISFFAVNQGPGAFSSLRVIIAMVNAIAFSNSIKLVGVDGLDALARETEKKHKNSINNSIIIPLLNAYNNEVYYSLDNKKGYKKIDLLIDDIEKKFPDNKLLFTGNGATLHKKLILDRLSDRGDRVGFESIETASSKQIGELGFESWEKGESISRELQPLYLKLQAYALRK